MGLSRLDELFRAETLGRHDEEVLVPHRYVFRSKNKTSGLSRRFLFCQTRSLGSGGLPPILR